MTTTTMAVAKARQLDWLLAEGLGSRGLAALRPKARARSTPWLVAAIAMFAVGAALGVAWLRDHDDRAEVQEPAIEIPWQECHGADALAALPADVTALHCFDFDDAACAKLARFTALAYLNLSGTDVDASGTSRSLSITDAGVQALAPLTSLRWLSLQQCHAMKGEGLAVLEAMPRLEHLDLTYSGVESPAIERLPRLPSLRTLVLSHCMNFHGRSLAAVAKVPGLRRLELRACTTLAAKDVLLLVNLKELRHLDLRDCQGRFRGQTLSEFSAGGEEPPPPPVQDSIGITDAVIEALATLPLQTLLLGGSESLGDAIGLSLGKNKALRSLDVSHLPKATGALLAALPNTLEELWLDDNGQFTAADFARLPPMPRLRTFGLSGLSLDEPTLQRLLADKPLRALSLGGRPAQGKGERPPAFAPLPTTIGDLLAKCTELASLDLRAAPFLTRDLLTAIAKLPRLRTLDLTGALTNPLVDRSEVIGGLATNRSLHSLRLVWNRLTLDSLRQLRDVPLRELDLRGSNVGSSELPAALASWPGCAVTMPNGQRVRVP